MEQAVSAAGYACAGVAGLTKAKAKPYQVRQMLLAIEQLAQIEKGKK